MRFVFAALTILLCPTVAFAQIAPDPNPEKKPEETGPCAVDKESYECKKGDKWEKTSVFGVRGSITNTSGAETDGTFVSGVVQGASEEYKTEKILTLHESSHASLGGGSANLEGGLGMTFNVGVRAPIGEHHGPLTRLGIGGEFMGNSRFYFSRLVLPSVEVAYQYYEGRTLLEMGVRGAPIITGRYNTGHSTRRELGDGSLEGGAYLSAHAEFGRLDVSATRIFASDNFPGGPVDVLRGWACGYVKDLVAICADGMLIQGEAYSPGRVVRDVKSIYAGMTIGVLAF